MVNENFLVIYIWMFQAWTPVLVLTERFCAPPPTQNQEQVQESLKLQIKCFAWGNIVHHILPRGFWVLLLNGNTRARCSYLISKYPSILEEGKSFISFSFFLKDGLSALHEIYAHIEKQSYNLVFPVETLHLPCGNRPHQTELVKNFLSMASHKQRCGTTIHILIHLSIPMYRNLSLKDNESFIDFR